MLVIKCFTLVSLILQWVSEDWNRFSDGIVSAETVNAFKARLVLSINTCISCKYIYYVSSIVYCNTHIDFMKTCIDLIMHVFIYLTLADRYSSSDS